VTVGVRGGRETGLKCDDASRQGCLWAEGKPMVFVKGIFQLSHVDQMQILAPPAMCHPETREHARMDVLA
jgi:hypothetical protein